MLRRSLFNKIKTRSGFKIKNHLIKSSVKKIWHSFIYKYNYSIRSDFETLDKTSINNFKPVNRLTHLTFDR